MREQLVDKSGHGFRHFERIAPRAVLITSCDVYRAFGRLWKSEPGPADPVPLTEDSPLRERPAVDGRAFDFHVVERHTAEWVRRIGDAVGWTGEILEVPNGLLPDQLRRHFDFRQQYVVDSGLIRRELDYREHVNEDVALRRTIEWELRNLVDVSDSEYASEDAVARERARRSRERPGESRNR